jgi:hypothetical protein
VSGKLWKLGAGIDFDRKRLPVDWLDNGGVEL